MAFKIRVIVVDRTRSPFLKQGESFYLDRLNNYARVEWVEVKPAAIKKGRPGEEVLNVEGEAIARRLNPRDYLVALDRAGHQYDSEELAAWLEKFYTDKTFFIAQQIMHFLQRLIAIL